MCIRDRILGPETMNYTTVYVDDLLITSSNWEEHCTRVERVLEKLSINNVTLKLEKSKLIAEEVIQTYSHHTSENEL